MTNADVGGKKQVKKRDSQQDLSFELSLDFKASMRSYCKIPYTETHRLFLRQDSQLTRKGLKNPFLKPTGAKKLQIQTNTGFIMAISV